MSEQKTAPPGPDLTKGISARQLREDGQLLGHVGDDPVLVVQVDDQIFAIGATCTHYHGTLADGLVVGDTVRCPWHHACFSLRTGEAVRAPALDPVACWQVDREGDQLLVRTKRPARPPRALPPDRAPTSVVIAGGGAAGLAAADTLRREGYDGPITMISADADPPCDRPNLSKDYLAGTAQEAWMPLKDAAYFEEQSITLLLSSRAVGIDPRARVVATDTGTTVSYDALLVATGADPVRLDVPGADDPRLHYLRSFADCRAIIQALEPDMTVAVIGAGFIGLEVAASLRTRGIETHLIAPAARPLEHVLGEEAGDFIRRLHEENGVVFHLGEHVTAINRAGVSLSSGATVRADLIVAGIGVRPATGFLETAGVTLDRGVSVNEYLETNVPGIFAAGDLARWPDPHTGDRIRVEHWVVAQRQGQTAARNMLGAREPFDAVPFFWSQHYDAAINYVGHAATWDTIERTGEFDARDCTLTFRRGGRMVALATIGRDRESLHGEVELEQVRASR